MEEGGVMGVTSGHVVSQALGDISSTLVVGSILGTEDEHSSYGSLSYSLPIRPQGNFKRMKLNHLLYIKSLFIIQ